MGDQVMSDVDAAPPGSGEEATWSWPRRGSGVFGLLVTVIVAVFVGLPLLFLTLKEPEPRVVTDLGGEVTGTFVSAGSTTFKLYPYADPQASFPAGAPMTGPLPRILVKFKQGEELTRYRLQEFQGAYVPVARSRLDGHTLAIVPSAPLAQGRYCVIVPKGGMYPDEVTYAYFSAAP